MLYKLNTSASSNTAIGASCLDSNTTGHTNTAIGVAALGANTTGNQNTAIGGNAGDNCTTGAQNTYLGDNAGNTHATGINCVYIGHASNCSSTSVDTEIVLGVAAAGKGTRTFFVNSDLGVFHGGNTTTWSTVSDERIKKNITNNNVGLDIITKLQPRNFEYKTEEEVKLTDLASVSHVCTVEKTGTQLGFIAQELEEVIPSAVYTDANGIKNVQPDNVIFYLINAIKELETRLAAVEAA